MKHISPDKSERDKELRLARLGMWDVLNVLNRHGHDPSIPDPECPSCSAAEMLRKLIERTR
jgi:hypothetical protein